MKPQLNPASQGDGSPASCPPGIVGPLLGCLPRVKLCLRCRIILFSALLMGVAGLVSIGLSLQLSKRTLRTETLRDVLWIAALLEAVPRSSASDQQAWEDLRGWLSRAQVDHLVPNNATLALLRPLPSPSPEAAFEVTPISRESVAESGAIFPVTPSLTNALAGVAGAPKEIAREGESWWSGLAPIRSPQGNVIALLRLDRQIGMWATDDWHSLLPIVAAGLLAIVLSLILATWFARSVSAPLVHVIRSTQAVARGEWSSIVPTGRSDEVGDLVRAFNSMVEALNAAHAAKQAQDIRMERVSAVMARSRDFLNNLVSSLPQFIAQKDLEGRYTFVTEFMCLTLGLQADEIIGNTDRDLFPERVATARRNSEILALREGRQVESVEEIEVAAGGRRWFKGVTMPLRNEAGERMGVQSVFWDVTELKDAEAKLTAAHSQLLDASRMAGMAEVATSVLHNVGNVLNSVNVSATLVRDRLRESRLVNLGRAVGLLEEHAPDIGEFFTTDPKGRQLTAYLRGLASYLEQERADMAAELQSLTRNVEHIKQIVSTQQNYAKLGGLVEPMSIAALVDDALRINATGLAAEQVEVIRAVQDVPPVLVDKHKTLQILVNLVGNARHALRSGTKAVKRLTIGVAWNGEDRVRVIIQDNGIGIAPENLTRIFQHGFTTKREGHGFGLHSGALAAREMGGALTVHSDGPGEGATFVLELKIAVSSGEESTHKAA